MSEENKIQENVQPLVETSDVFTNMGFTREDVQTFMKWSLGQEADPPQIVRKMMNNLSQKLTVSLGLSITSNATRQTKLMDSLRTMEDRFLDGFEWDNLEFEQKLALYKEMRKTNSDLMETQRKFIAQNKELIPAQDTDQGKLMAMIMTMSPEKLKKLIEIMETEDIESDSGDIEDIV